MRRPLPGEPFALLHVLFLQGSSGNLGPDCGVYVNVGATFVMPDVDPSGITNHECVLGFRVAQPDDLWDLSEATLDPIATTVDDQAGRMVRRAN